MGHILTKEELKGLENDYHKTYEEIDKLKTHLFEINKQVVDSIIAEAESRFIPLETGDKIRVTVKAYSPSYNADTHTQEIKTEVYEGFYDGFETSSIPDRILHYEHAERFTYLHLSRPKKDGTMSKIHDDLHICSIVSIEKVEE